MWQKQEWKKHRLEEDFAKKQLFLHRILGPIGHNIWFGRVEQKILNLGHPLKKQCQIWRPKNYQKWDFNPLLGLNDPFHLSSHRILCPTSPFNYCETLPWRLNLSIACALSHWGCTKGQRFPHDLWQEDNADRKIKKKVENENIVKKLFIIVVDAVSIFH